MRLLPTHPLSPVSLAPMLVRMMLPKPEAAPGPWQTLSQTGAPQRISRRHLHSYQELCGFDRDDVLPLTYPHLLALPLHLQVLTDPRFPISLPGTVHLGNRIVQKRDIYPDETLHFTVTTPEPVLTPRGREFSLVTTAHSNGEEIWRGVSTMLRPESGPFGKPSQPKTAPAWPHAQTWPLAANLGRRYARVSGDFNPIHLSALSARLFGFHRPIIHGMWSCARSLAALPPMLRRGAVALDVQFRRPLSLPGEACFQYQQGVEGTDFQLVSPDQSQRYLVGRIKPRDG